MEKVNEYSNDEITIIWKPGLCIHAGICVKTLPDVYNPNKRPWIEIENASSSALKEQVFNCPSGALSYRINKQFNGNSTNRR